MKNQISFGDISYIGDNVTSFAKALASLFYVISNARENLLSVCELIDQLRDVASRESIKITDWLWKASALPQTDLLAILAGQITEITGEFNGIIVKVTKDSIAESIVADFHAQLNEQIRQYENSPEGKKDKEDEEKELKRMQSIADESMKELPNLNFKNNLEILNWLCKIQDATGTIAVVINKKEIISLFNKNGFKRNANTGKKFKENDEDNFAKYIVGQALDGLQCEVGAIHNMVVKFTNDWKEKFHKENATT